MKFRLTVKKKIGTAVGAEFTEAEPVSTLGVDGTFEADNIGFARRDCNTYIREWVEGMGMKLRTQKDWVKNMKTKLMEKQVMAQSATGALTFVFILEQL
ncbi:MAG: hypothetical protein IJ571_00115 [Ruminococcus sp.]|nr:hypothetical protein [Ruminococcus sp.]